MTNIMIKACKLMGSSIQGFTDIILKTSGVLLLALAVCSIVKAESPPHISSNDIERVSKHLIDTAIFNIRHIPAYTFTTYKIENNCAFKILRIVQNAPDGSHNSRTELEMINPDGAKMRKIIVNSKNGIWELNGNEATRLPSEKPYVRVPPSRLLTGSLIGDMEAPLYDIKYNQKYFGIDTIIVSISLKPSSIIKFRSQPKALKNAAIRRIRAMKERNDEDNIEKNWYSLASNIFPVAYVYYITSKDHFIVSWKSLTIDGEILKEISIPEFRVLDSVPSQSFDLTSIN